MRQTNRRQQLSAHASQTQGSIDELSAIFMAMTDAVFVFDADGRIVRMNDAAATLTQAGENPAFVALPLGARRAVLEMRDLDGRILPREEWPATRALRGERLIGAAAPDVLARTPDGHDLVLNISGAPLFDAQGQVTGAVCVSRDVTERKRLERELAERAAEMESIFATQVEGVVYADSAGHIIRMNDAQRQLLLSRGVDPTAEHIDAWAGTTPPYDAQGRPVPRDRLPFYRALRGETIAREEAVELHQRGRDGRDLAVRISAAPVRDAQGRIVGVVSTTHDVTQQRLLEQELAERASQIESIFDAQVDGIILCDTQARIIRMNTAQRQMLGLDITEEGSGFSFAQYAMRRNPRDIENRPLSYEQGPMMRVLRGEILTGAQAVELRFRALDGRELIAQISGAPVRDAAGHIIGGVVAVRDITERRQLEQQQRDVLRVVAHDLMNPITGMRLYFQSQERRLRLGQPAFVPDDALLNALKASVTRMEHLVNDLRAVTSIEAGALSLDRRPCDLSALCRREVEVQRLLAPNRAVQFEAPEQPLQADVDEQRVGQVVANFLSNALKYSPADCPVNLTLRADGAIARIAVQDAGPGIPETEFARLWERFHRVEGVKAQDGAQSLGLGLYICRAIIEQHGGQVGVESELGAGSTFWCTLPLASTQ